MKSLPQYYRDMLVRGHPAYHTAHNRDGFIMSQLARATKYNRHERPARRHFYRAWQGSRP